MATVMMVLGLLVKYGPIVWQAFNIIVDIINSIKSMKTLGAMQTGDSMYRQLIEQLEQKADREALRALRDSMKETEAECRRRKAEAGKVKL